MLKSRFKNPHFEEQFSKNGFIHIKRFIDKALVEKLFLLFKEVYRYNDVEKGAWNSLYNIAFSESNNISKTILSHLSDKLEETFIDYKAPVGTFMNKNPNKFSNCDIHRDFSILDELVYEYRNLWIPLVDTSINNGTLYALKGSHHFFNYPLPMFCKWPYLSYQKFLMNNCSIINSEAGDLVVYADRTLHGSFINNTNEPRPVVHFGIMHPEAEITYYYLEENGNTKVYSVPANFFLENNFGNQDGKYPMKREFMYCPPIFSEKDIKNGLNLSN